MLEEQVGLESGGQMNFVYYEFDGYDRFFDESVDEERVEGMLEVFI